MRLDSAAAPKMDMHIPKAGNHELSTRIDDPGILRNLRFAEFANCLNAITDNDDRAVGQRRLSCCVDDGHIGERERVGLRREGV